VISLLTILGILNMDKIKSIVVDNIDFNNKTFVVIEMNLPFHSDNLFKIFNTMSLQISLLAWFPPIRTRRYINGTFMKLEFSIIAYLFRFNLSILIPLIELLCKLTFRSEASSKHLKNSFDSHYIF